MILFSTNARKFKMDPALSNEAQIREITEETIPADFQQHRPHRCWVIRKSK
jgi:23S rRNA G2069 N7-methylase RlmK/C1962 C5-methylase RlmI